MAPFFFGGWCNRVLVLYDCVTGGDCPKSQTFLSENRESAFGFV